MDFHVLYMDFAKFVAQIRVWRRPDSFMTLLLISKFQVRLRLPRLFFSRQKRQNLSQNGTRDYEMHNLEHKNVPKTNCFTGLVWPRPELSLL